MSYSCLKNNVSLIQSLQAILPVTRDKAKIATRNNYDGVKTERESNDRNRLLCIAACRAWCDLTNTAHLVNLPYICVPVMIVKQIHSQQHNFSQWAPRMESLVQINDNIGIICVSRRKFIVKKTNTVEVNHMQLLLISVNLRIFLFCSLNTQWNIMVK